MADLHRSGITLRNPLLYGREGIPGSGGPDWMKNKYEYIVCATRGGKLPWVDTTAMGHPPKYGLGGPMSNRDRNGERLFNKQTRRKQDGIRGDYEPSRPMPKLSNPGNIIWCGANTHFGKIAHENEAPFPEKLAEWMIRSFAPPGGLVLDPFAGSFTTCAVALRLGRRWSGIDIRESQIRLGKRRILEAKQKLRKERQHG